ncbi:MAG: energy transducer TonB [Desulfatiglandales bacterium]
MSGVTAMVRVKNDMWADHKMTAPSLRGKPNWLLRALFIISFGIHIVVFLHVLGIYRENNLNYIELSVENVDRPPSRSIPRPRLRPKATPQPKEVERLKATVPKIPHFKPIKMTPSKNPLPDSLMESIALPEIPGTPDLTSVQFSPSRIETGGGEFDTPNTYLEMVRMKIERHKNYPDKAKGLGIQGAVVVGFVIGTDGHVRKEEIVKSSGHTVLDGAAINAVKNASPFARPPQHLFGGDVPLTVTIVFELT